MGSYEMPPRALALQPRQGWWHAKDFIINLLPWMPFALSRIGAAYDAPRVKRPQPTQLGYYLHSSFSSHPNSSQTSRGCNQGQLPVSDQVDDTWLPTPSFSAPSALPGRTRIRITSVKSILKVGVLEQPDNPPPHRQPTMSLVNVSRATRIPRPAWPCVSCGHSGREFFYGISQRGCVKQSEIVVRVDPTRPR